MVMPHVSSLSFIRMQEARAATLQCLSSTERSARTVAAFLRSPFSRWLISSTHEALACMPCISEEYITRMASPETSFPCPALSEPGHEEIFHSTSMNSFGQEWGRSAMVVVTHNS